MGLGRFLGISECLCGQALEGMKVSRILLSIYSAHGFGGGGLQCCLGIITHDLQLTRGRDGIVTFILY